MALRDSFRPHHILMALATLALLAIASSAFAQTWNETGDAGDLVATAQVTNGIGPLQTINGSLPLSDDVDLYCIQLTAVPPGGLPIIGLQCVLNQGPNIWLFDANGNGVVMNETCQGGLKQLLAPNGGMTPGNYYVGVSYYGRNATSAGGFMWNPGVVGQHTPDGPGAPGPLTSWTGVVTMNPLNPYTITLNQNYFGYCSAATPTRNPTWGGLKSYYR
jgi:hypothetical protein